MYYVFYARGRPGDVLKKLGGNVDQYLKALEDEIERAKHQRDNVAYIKRMHVSFDTLNDVEAVDASMLGKWDDYIEYLENLRVEACLLFDFEQEDEDGTVC